MSEARTLIVVALIGAAATIGAALIGAGSLFSGEHGEAAERVTPPGASEKPAAVTAMVGPHAPEIQINQSYTLWGENTLQVRLEPGQSRTLKAMELYEDRTTYPSSSCAGPGFVPYTWQVRQPWPKGGDIEIREMIPRGGGATERIGLGSLGSAQMGYCSEHTIKNNDVEPVTVEIRYASAADLEGIESPVDAAVDAPAVADKK